MAADTDRNNPVQAKKFTDFSGGMVNSSISDMRFLWRGIDLEYDPQGRLKVRSGYSVGPDSPTFNVSTTAVYRFWAWYDSSNTVHYLILDQAGDIYEGVGANKSDFSGAAVYTGFSSVDVQMASMDTKAYFVSFVHDTVSFDGTTWTAITDSTLDGSGTEFPRASLVLQANSRMFAFCVNAGGADYTSRLWFSEFNDAETWLATSYIDVAPDDGTQISAAIAFKDAIVIFKDTSVWLLTGKDPDSFSLVHLTDTYGAQSDITSAHAPNRTVASSDRRVYFFDSNLNMIVVFDGVKFAVVAKAFRNSTYMPTGWHKDTVGLYYVDRYILTYKNAGAGTYPDRQIVYWENSDAITVSRFGFVFAFRLQNGNVYICGTKSLFGVDDVGYYVYDSGATDGSSTSYPLSAFISQWYPLVDLGTRCKVKYVDFLFETNLAAVDYAVILIATLNYFVSSSQVSRSTVVTQVGYGERLRLYGFDTVSTGPRRIESIQFAVSFIGQVDGTDVRLAAVELGFQAPPLRARGDRKATE